VVIFLKLNFGDEIYKNIKNKNKIGNLKHNINIPFTPDRKLLHIRKCV